MALNVGDRLGHYDVTALIGKGGMGQVYRATDTQLNRDVALKILPDAFAADPDRLARFQREAQVLASLNHPNIAQIHGIEEAAGTRALVLELVEGPTLGDRIAHGPIPLGEALPIAKQIAEALEAAHEQGIIHRDLKPANVKVRDDGTVKVLDFGLAKALDPLSSGGQGRGEGEGEGEGFSASPTISLTAAATQMGMVIGTAAYMAPEQAKGLPVDKRADIWAYGAVLFEMLTGRKLFEAGDASEMLASVLVKDPDISGISDHVPAHIRSVVRQCLVKDPKERLRDIGDVRLAMRGVFETKVTAATDASLAPLPIRPVWRRVLPLVASAVVAGLLVGLAVWSLTRPGPQPATVTRFPLILPVGDVIDGGDGMALSPDGTTLAYAASRDGVQQLFVRTRDQVTPRPLPGTEDAVQPFFSPDGAWVGFFTPGSLKKVALAGGPPVTLCSVGFRRGATWGPDETIVFASGAAPGLMEVSAAGGEPRSLTTPADGETQHLWPSFVPGGRAVVYTVGPQGSPSDKEVRVLSFESGESRTLARGTSATATRSGHLVFAREASLWAVPFDIEGLTVTGEPAPLVEGVQVNPGGNWAHYAVADDGTLVFLPVSGTFGLNQGSLVWVDRQGQEEPIDVPPRFYLRPRISPDGTRVALDLLDEENDIWVWDFAGETLTRLTFAAEPDEFGSWTPDGERVVFSSARDGPNNLYWKAADGTGTAERLTESDNRQAVNAVTPDGTRVVAQTLVPNRAADLIVVTLDGEHVTDTVLGTEFVEREAALSPDGAWVAFESDESGQFEVYVRPFPDVEAGRWQVSTTGGVDPAWSPDGGELFYLAGDRFMAASIQTAPSFSRGTPQMLFQRPYVGAFGRDYDVAADGRFLMLSRSGQTAEDAPPSQINVVLNWFEELSDRVPTP